MTRDFFVDILLISAIIPLLISIVLYVRVPWYKTSLGRFFMGYHFCMMLFWVFFLFLRHDLGVSRSLLINSSFVVFIGMSVFLWWGTFLMFKYTVKERKRIDVQEKAKERRWK